MLDPVANECLKIATGAFKSSPIESLNVLCNEMSLEHRRQVLTLKYYYRMKSQLDNPAFDILIAADRLLYRNKRLQPTLAIRAQELVETINLPTTNKCPAFSYTLLNQRKPSWELGSPALNVDLMKDPKLTTADIAYRQNFHQLV